MKHATVGIVSTFKATLMYYSRKYSSTTTSPDDPCPGMRTSSRRFYMGNENHDPCAQVRHMICVGWAGDESLGLGGAKKNDKKSLRNKHKRSVNDKDGPSRRNKLQQLRAGQYGSRYGCKYIVGSHPTSKQSHVMSKYRVNRNPGV